MTQVFLKLLNMSITASWIVLAVLVLRIVFRKAPKWICCVLWSVVALRLILPFSVESMVSLIPSPEVIPQDIIQSETPAIHSGIPALNSAVNPLFTVSLTPEVDLLEKGLSIAAIVWIVGVGVMLLYSMITYLRIQWQVRGAIRQEKNIYICDNVDSPFVLGMITPKIYIPFNIGDTQMTYVLAHENAHIKRLDYLWKPLGFMLLTVYWFNPILWGAYILLCRDIEMACDEKVIAGMDGDGKRGYSETLLACSMHRRMIMACPVAFGEVSIKSRIKNVMRYKKPALGMVLVSLVVCVITGGCFLTNPLPCMHCYQSEVMTEATCTSRGVGKYTCSQCQHVYTSYIDMCEHSYGESVVTLEATCTREGVIQQSCTQCDTTKNAVIALAPHTAGETISVQEPNCTQEGKRSATCVHCAQTFVLEVLPVNNVHDMKETVLRAATCTDSGEGVNACTRCDYSENVSYQAVGHKYTSGNVRRPTCEEKGSTQYVCSVCQHKKQTSVPAYGHIWTHWYQNVAMCVRCGDAKNTSNNNSSYSLNDGIVRPSRTPQPDQLPVIKIWP